MEYSSKAIQKLLYDSNSGDKAWRRLNVSFIAAAVLLAV